MCRRATKFDRKSGPILGRRAGFTLLEMLLVLVVMVVLGTMASMIVKTAYQGQRLQAAADKLRYALNQTRYLAMSSGQTYLFQATLGGNEGIIGMWESDNLDQQAMVAGGKITLQEGMTFANGATRDVRASATGQVQGFTQPDSSSGGGQIDVFYFPDGSSSEAQIVIANADKREIMVTVHGLTGTSATVEANSNSLATGSGT